MIDLRCHLLGEGGRLSGGFDEGLRMCRLAAGEGVRTIVATLAWPAGAKRPPLDLEEYGLWLERMGRELNEGPGLVPGFVLGFNEELPLLAEEYGARLALGGGRHLLVSLPALDTPASVEGVWEEIRRLDFGVVVARPECSPALRRQPERLARWADRGVTLQLDAASITGAHGREVQRFALQLVCEHGAAGRVLVASNARDAGARRPSLAAAADTLAGKFGRARALQLVERTPARVVGEGAGARGAGRGASLRRAWAEVLRTLRGGAVQQG